MPLGHWAFLPRLRATPFTSLGAKICCISSRRKMALPGKCSASHQIGQLSEAQETGLGRAERIDFMPALDPYPPVARQSRMWLADVAMPVKLLGPQDMAEALFAFLA